MYGVQVNNCCCPTTPACPRLYLASALVRGEWDPARGLASDALEQVEFVSSVATVTPSQRDTMLIRKAPHEQQGPTGRFLSAEIDRAGRDGGVRNVADLDVAVGTTSRLTPLRREEVRGVRGRRIKSIMETLHFGGLKYVASRGR